jgi:RNA polymerase sigma factor (sigma-70 family)
MSVITPSRPSTQVPTDPTAIWDASKRILFAVAKEVRQAVRDKLEGHGRYEAEAEELVNDAYIALVEAMPRYDPSKGRWTTFAFATARRRMWLYARACFHGLSPEQQHRMDTAKRTPRYHRGHLALSLAPAPREETGERLSVRKVEAIRQRLPRKDRRLLDLFLEEGGNYTAVARRLKRKASAVRWRYHRLARRIAAGASASTN